MAVVFLYNVMSVITASYEHSKNTEVKSQINPLQRECCMTTWWETNVAISWEITRKEWGGDRYSQNIFPISYTCFKCGRKWKDKYYQDNK